MSNRKRHTTNAAIALTLFIGAVQGLGVRYAAAQDGAARNEARAMFSRGQTAYTQGDYEAAIQYWNDAYARDPRPLLQFNIAQAYEKQGKLVESVEAFEKYLATADPSDSYQTEARARLGSVRERLRSTGINIVSGPEGARIFVDGKEWGRTPRPDAIQVPPGSHEVVLTLEGYAEFRSLVVVPPGQNLQVPVQMARSGGKDGGKDGRTASSTPADDGAPPADAPRRASKRSMMVPYILWGVAGAALATGVVLGIVAMGKASDAPSQESAEADSAKGLAIGADIAFGTAIAAGAVGTVLFFLNKNHNSRAGSTARAWSVSPLVTSHSNGAMFHVRF